MPPGAEGCRAWLRSGSRARPRVELRHTSILRFERGDEVFETEENVETVLRPEEVLIFFENPRTEGNVRTIVPAFSPALPANQPTIESKATYRVE